MAAASAPVAPANGDANVSTLDLEAYLSNYTGITRIRRLAFIASTSPAYKKDALAIAVAEVKRTSNTALYLELVANSGDDGGMPRDDAWVEQVDRKSQQRLDKLESDLNNHKTSLVKESIRMGHTDLGEFHYERGDFNAALKCFVRTRDYCTTSKHIIAMCLNVIKASIRTPPAPHHCRARAAPRRALARPALTAARARQLALGGRRVRPADAVPRPARSHPLDRDGKLHPRGQLHH